MYVVCMHACMVNEMGYKGPRMTCGMPTVPIPECVTPAVRDT